MSCRKWEVQILRWHEGRLDQVAEARLLRHVGGCIHCRSVAEKFSELDDLFSKSQEPSFPPFLKERIVSTVSEAMRQDSMRGSVSRFSDFLVSFRPAVAAVVLVLGIGLGVVTGWNLAQSVSRDATGSSYDLLSLAGFGGAGSGSSLEFIWTDSNGRTGQ
jgi:predicted anti-sigma-YlaC factor YlaD